MFKLEIGVLDMVHSIRDGGLFDVSIFTEKVELLAMTHSAATKLLKRTNCIPEVGLVSGKRNGRRFYRYFLVIIPRMIQVTHTSSKPIMKQVQRGH